MRAMLAGLVLALALFGASSLFSASPDDSSIIYTLTGDRQYDEFGYSATALGDVDGDGVPDFAVGSLQTFFTSEATGKVQVFSGKEGKVLWTWHGERQSQEFGSSISVFQDLDGDGKKDVAIADESEMVHIYSTGTGELIKQINIRGKETSIGVHISNFPDVNHDGVEDLLIGHPGQGIQQMIGLGRVAIYSGQDGTLIWEVMGKSKEGLLGDSIAVIGDVDGDGINDVAAGESHGWSSIGDHLPGTVYIFSGVDGREIRQLGNDPQLIYLGHRMANVGDLDGDGWPELAIGATGYSVKDVLDVGWVGIYSTRTFELLRSFRGIDGHIGFFQGDQLGFAVGSAGDADGDGVPDLLLGTSRFGTAIGRSEWGRVELRSGKSGNLLAAFEGYQSGDYFVWTLAPVGDIDGDGRSDFLIGSNTSPSPRGPGQALLIHYRPELPTFIRGDGNQDGRVNLADVVFLARMIYFHDSSGPCAMALDVNGDGTIDFYDIASVIYFFFEARFAPAAPFPECGRYGGFQEPQLSCESSACSPGEQ